MTGEDGVVSGNGIETFLRMNLFEKDLFFVKAQDLGLVSPVDETREKWRVKHWKERQFPSDWSTPRVRKFRAFSQMKEGNVAETVTETFLPEERRPEKTRGDQKKKEPPPTPRVRFVKPTVEEIQAEIDRMNALNPGRCFGELDAEDFFLHYEKVGWKAGKNPLVNWKMAVVEWEKRRRRDQ